MVVFGSKLRNVPIIGLSSGTQIGLAERPVIDWTTLKIAGLICSTRENSSLLLLAQDVREYNSGVILINSEDDLVASQEIIRLQPLLKAEFRLIGAQVRTESGTKLGQVSDYTFDPRNFEIQQLHLKRNLLRGLIAGGLIIHRRQIVEVTPAIIVVRDGEVREQAGAVQPVA